MSLAMTIRNRLPTMDLRHRTESLELVTYWRSIYKHKWFILAVAAVLGGAAAVATSFMTPIYRTSVTLMVEQNRSRVISMEEVYSGVSSSREHYQTQTEILKSPALAAKVIQRLNLADNAEFNPRQQKPPLWKQYLPWGADVDKGSWTDDRVQAAVLKEFLSRVSVEPARFSQIVRVNFDAADRVLGSKIANAIAESYIETDINTRQKMTEQASSWLADRLTLLKQNLEESERALQQYREREGLLDTRGLAQGGATRQLETLASAAASARERRFDTEHRFRQTTKDPARLHSLPVVLAHPLVERLKDQEARAERRVAALSERYGPEHIRMVEARKEFDSAREATRRGIQTVIASYGKEHEIAAQDERAVQRMLGAAKGAIQDMNRKEFQLEALERDVASNRQIYERFLNRYRETTAAPDGQNSAVARIVDPAIPGRLYKPQKERIVSIAFALGLLLGAIIALLRERIDNTVKSAEEVEDKLGLPTVAVLPLIATKAGNAAGRHYLDEPQSVFSEAIRTARTGILLSAIDTPNKTLLITSSLPSEGKSAFAINLALAHAQAKKTLLIEADLRRPSVAHQLGLDSSKPGLTDLFAGKATFSECVQRVEGSTLYVLPAGPSPSNPLELVSSERFKLMLERVAAACELVIVDSPPVHLVSDAVVLSTMTTGVLFVVKADSTPHPVARRVIRNLQDAGANVIGVVLNQLDFAKANRYYGAYTHYAKEYGAFHANKAVQTP